MKLRHYLSLMAADILVHEAERVPLGKDQRQHLELTRYLAQRMNGAYGTLFTVPEAVISEAGARIMPLDDSTQGHLVLRKGGSG